MELGHVLSQFGRVFRKWRFFLLEFAGRCKRRDVAVMTRIANQKCQTHPSADNVTRSRDLESQSLGQRCEKPNSEKKRYLVVGGSGVTGSLIHCEDRENACHQGTASSKITERRLQ